MSVCGLSLVGTRTFGRCRRQPLAPPDPERRASLRLAIHS